MNGRRFGATPENGGVTFRLWAPGAKRVEVVLDGRHEMRGDDAGWFSTHIPGAVAGSLYRFRIDGGLEVPDPASHFQPQDVAGPSEVVDHTSYQWRAKHWCGRPWEDAVFLESHVGTFTADGTYRAMIEKLDHLVETGITALELMPLADFPGRRNWGYDGVLWYAPDNVYGRPDDLKMLIDEAHLRGMMVFLDVVYNHFGPEGNYLGHYAPPFFSPSQTPWGNAIDYRVPQVRQFAIENALYWLRDYRFDGLRLDAVQAIVEVGEPPVLHDLSIAVGELAKASGRYIHLVLENDDNRASLLDPKTDPPQGKYRAQWNDDYHHAWHALLTGETGDYYRDYANPRQDIARALGSGFAYQGETSLHRGGKRRGEVSAGLSPTAFVGFLQNHDQIGNRALGDRLEVLAKPVAIEAALAITLLAPMPPMLFMGEEWGSQTPFPFFCDFGGDLANAIRQGRRREFQSAYDKYGDDIPDPLDESTFELAKLGWDGLGSVSGRKRLTLVRELLAVRRAHVLGHLAAIRFGGAHAADNGTLIAQWAISNSRALKLTANLSDNNVAPIAINPTDQVIWGKTPDQAMSPWSVVWIIGEA